MSTNPHSTESPKNTQKALLVLNVLLLFTTLGFGIFFTQKIAALTDDSKAQVDFMFTPATPERIKEAITKCRAVGQSLYALAHPATNSEIDRMLADPECDEAKNALLLRQRTIVYEMMKVQPTDLKK